MNLNIKKLLIWGGAVLVSVLFLAVYVGYALNRPNSASSDTRAFYIKPGTSVSQIASDLEKNKLIQSATLFTLYVRASGSLLEAGDYDVPSNLSVITLVDLLRHGTDDVALTFIEGLRSEEYAEYVSGKLRNVNEEEFLALVRAQKLEGKLFPDTYFVNKGISTEQLVKLLFDSFTSKTDGVSSNLKGLTEEEVLILASIVEREEPTASERSTVAGILIARYQNGELLGADATIQYFSGSKGAWWPKDLTQVQLDTPSPYNTRKLTGLPPAPICNPGIDSIKAVVNYKQTSYRYYLHDKDGKVHYATTLEEHDHNRSLYL